MTNERPKIVGKSRTDTSFGKRGGASDSGGRIAAGHGVLYALKVGFWFEAPDTFTILAFTSRRIANTYAIIPPDFAL